MLLYSFMRATAANTFEIIEHGDVQNREASVFRTLELIDLTIEDSRWKNRLKEITRLREVFCNWYMNKNEYQITPSSLEKYCISFSL